MARRIGTAGSDSLSGTPKRDFIQGRAGDDFLSGLGGSDTIGGGPGNDTLDGGAGKDKLTGGGGNDAINGGAGKDRLNGGPGNDRLDGQDGRDILFGGRGEDTFVVVKGQDRALDYVEGEDTIIYVGGPAVTPEPGPRDPGPPDDKPEQPQSKPALPDYYMLLDRGIQWDREEPWRTLDNGWARDDRLGKDDGEVDDWDLHAWYPSDLEMLNHLLSGGDPEKYFFQPGREEGGDSRADLEALKALLNEYPPGEAFPPHEDKDPADNRKGDEGAGSDDDSQPPTLPTFESDMMIP